MKAILLLTTLALTGCGFLNYEAEEDRKWQERMDAYAEENTNSAADIPD